MTFVKDNRISSIINLSRQAFGEYKTQIIVLTILGFITGILEGIGVNALIPLFSFALGDGQGGNDVISQAIQKFFLFLNIEFSVTYLLIFITILFVLKAIISIILTYLQQHITTDYERNTRNNLFQKIIQSNWPHLIKQKLGNLETIIMIDVPASANLLGQIGNAITLSTSLLIYLLVAVNISLPVTLATLIVGAIFFLILKPLIYKTKILSYQRVSINKEITHHVGENILGIKSVKTMVAGDGIIKKAAEYFKQLKHININIAMLKSYITAFIQPLSIIFICVLFAFTYRSDSFNFAALIAIVYLIQKIFIYIQQLQRNLHIISSLVPHLRSSLDYERSATEFKEINAGKNKFNFEDSLEFKNVNFSYNSDKQILKGLNLKIKKGEMVGLIGPSGVGKTTLVDLILRLFNPTDGQILLDGRDSHDINLDDWRKNIGYVSQDIFLINDSIANNIKFYNSSINKKDIQQVAKMANIYDFIQELPKKFDTLIGERGVLLSAGQRQRIVIARVLARNPKLLILDEATSALDNESELRIQEVIKKLKGKVTVLAIAHRLSTLTDSDKILVLDQGKINETGNPQQLLKDKDSYFFKVYNLRK